jgi:hypothetical protein
LDEGTIHIEYNKSWVPPEWCIGLEDNIKVPFAFEVVKELMFTKIG